ncbi:hypothetical protein BDAP_000433 [Binucleata daphniae]
MSIISDICKNTLKALCLKQIDASKSKFSIYFLLLTLFVLVRSLLILGFRYNKSDFIATIEAELAVMSFFQFFGTNLVFAFLIKLLSHKKDAPYKQVLSVQIFAKASAPIFTFLAALFSEYTFIFLTAYQILNTIYMYNNLKPNNKSKVWFWILMILLFLFASFDLFNFNDKLENFHGFYKY